MKKTVLLMMILSVFVFSCKNYIIENNFDNIPTDKNLDSVNELATVNLDFGSNARTVLPEFETSKLKNIVLKGKQNGGEQKTLATFANFTSLKSVGIDIGNWDFELTAQQENTTFSGNLTQTIKEGENTLSFTLKVQSYGNSDDNGSVNVVLTFPNDAGVKAINAGLYDVEGQTSVVDFETEPLPFASGKVVYKKTSVPVGTYFLKYDFYADAECTIFMNSYKEIVVIASGCESSAERTIDSLNEVYEITYELNGGEFKEGFTAPVSFTRNSTVSLPTVFDVKRTHYYLEGLYENADFSGEKITEFNKCTENKTVYAKWIRGYYISSGEIDSLDLSEEDEEYTIAVYGELGNNQLSKIKAKIKDVNYLVNLDFSDCLMTEISFRAFDGCGHLASVVIPKGVTKIGSYAFYICLSLESVAIPEGVTTIGDLAFYGCSSLKNVYYGGTASQWCNIDFSEYPSGATPLQNDDMNFYIQGELIKDVVIDSSVTKIPEKAFNGCTSLESVVIQEGVTTIGRYAFYECSSLISVVIPEGVTTIGDHAFYYCSSLESIVIPESVTSIGWFAFFNCINLDSVTFEDTTTWYYTSNSDYKNGSLIYVQDVSSNAKNLRYYLGTYYWYKE